MGAWEALALVALASACARPRPGDSDRPIEMLVANDPETLDPRYATDAVGLRTTRLLHAGLVRLDPDTLAPLPYAARAWRWLDPLTLEVTLRDDVRFHSGVPLRARDVIATLRAFASPAVGSRHAGVVEAIADVREEGDGAVLIRLSRLHATLLTDLELPVLREDQAASPPAPDGSLDGIGPFALVRAGRGEVLLAPATGAALPKPVHSVVIRTVHDENARALRLEAGRTDVSLNLVSPTLLPALERWPGLAVLARPGSNLTYVVVNEQHPLLADATVRQALSLAIDRPTICATLLGGKALPAGGLLGPANWAHADLALPSFDPVEARRLLADATATRPHLVLLTSTERLRGDIARFVAQEMTAAGIDLDVVPLELGTMIARLNSADFDLAILQLPEVTEPNVLRRFLHSASIPPSGANRGRVHDTMLDALLDEGDRTSGIDARRAIYARLEAHERTAMHWIPLWYEDQVAVTSVRARSFVPSAEGRWLSLAAIP